MNHRPSGKPPRLTLHGEGVGTLTKEDVERRAREIALIEDRPQVTDDDRERARAELLNRDLPPTVSEDAPDSMQSLSRDPSDPAVSRGRQTPEHGIDDGQQELEQLAVEGVEEAQHEQMLEARRQEEHARRRGL